MISGWTRGIVRSTVLQEMRVDATYILWYEHPILWIKELSSYQLEELFSNATFIHSWLSREFDLNDPR